MPPPYDPLRQSQLDHNRALRQSQRDYERQQAERQRQEDASLRQAESDQAAAERLVIQRQKQDQKAADAAARDAFKAEQTQREHEFRAEGANTYTTADGVIHKDPLFDQKQAEKAAKEAAALAAKQARAEAIRSGRRHQINPVDGTPIYLESEEAVSQRQREAGEKLRRTELDKQIAAREAEFGLKKAQNEAAGFKPLSETARKNLETKGLAKAKQDALFALQSHYGALAKGTDKQGWWDVVNNNATPEAQKAQEALQRLQSPDAELTDDDLAALESSSDPTNPALVKKLRTIQERIAKDDELRKAEADHNLSLADLKMRRDAPDQWAEAIRQRRATLPPDQLDAELQTSGATLQERAAAMQQQASQLNSQLAKHQLELDTLAQQAADRRSAGIPAGEIVTYDLGDGTTEAWPRDLAAQREQITAQLENTHAQQADAWALLKVQQEEWNRDAALHDEAVAVQQQTQDKQRQEFIQKLKEHPRTASAGQALEALDPTAPDYQTRSQALLAAVQATEKDKIETDRAAQIAYQRHGFGADLAQVLPTVGLDPANPDHVAAWEDAHKSSFAPVRISDAPLPQANGSIDFSAVLSDGTLVIHPQFTFDAKRYAEAVEKSDASPEAKAQAMADLPAKQLAQAESMLPMLKSVQQIPGIPSFAKWQKATNPKGSEPEQAKAYLDFMQARGFWEKLPDTVARNFLAGLSDIGTQAVGTLGALTGSQTLSEAAASWSQDANRLTAPMEAEGANDSLAGAVLGQTARMAGPMAAMLLVTRGLGGGIGTASAIAASQTAGSQYAESYNTLREQGLDHSEAWQRTAPYALASGLVTALLTKAGGKTGLEAALKSPSGKQAAQGFWKAAVRNIPKQAGAELAEELPDELFNQISQAVAEGRRSPQQIAETIGDFWRESPSLMGAIALMGGAGGAIETAEESLAARQQAANPYSAAPAWDAIENHVATDAAGNVDAALTDQQQRRASLALSLAQGGELFDVEEADLNAAGWTRDGDQFKPLKDYTGPQVLDIDKGGLPVVKDSYKQALRDHGLAAVADAIPESETETRNRHAQASSASQQPAGQNQPGPQQPQPGPAQGVAPDAVAGTNQGPVQNPPGQRTQPSPSGNPPAPDGAEVGGQTSASAVTEAPTTVSDTLANHLVERGLPENDAKAAAAKIVEQPEFAGMSYEQIIAEGPKFRAALTDLGIDGSLNSKDVATNPLTAKPASKLAKVKAEMEAKAAAAGGQTSVSAVSTGDFTVLRAKLAAKEISDQDAARQVAEQTGATTPEAFMAAVEKHLGWKPARAEIAAHLHFGTKDQSSIPLASGKRDASNRVPVAPSPSLPVSPSSKQGPDTSLAATPSALRKNRAYAADKLRVLAGIKDPARKAWARQFFIALEQSLQRHHLLYDAYAVGQAARRHLDGQMTAVLEIDGKITRLIDLDAMAAQFSYLGSPQDALRATSLEEDIHAQVLQLAREQPDKYGYKALRRKWQQLPDALKQAVWTAYRAANQQAANAAEVKLPKLSANQEWHLMNEFLRMLVQDARFAGQITETVDPSSGLLGWVKEFLRDLSKLLKSLMGKVQPALRAELDAMVKQIGDRLQQIETASTAQADRLAVLPSHRDPAAYATRVLSTLGTQPNTGILSNAALARVFDQLDPALQSRAFDLWKSDAGTPARKSPKDALMRGLLSQFLGSRRDSQRLAAVLAGLSTPPKTTSLLTKVMDALLGRVQERSTLDLLAVQDPAAKRNLANLHIAALNAIGGIRAASFVHGLAAKPGLATALEADAVNDVTSEAAARRKADFLAALAAREQDHEDARNDEGQAKLRARLREEEAANPAVESIDEDAARAQQRLADFLAALDDRDRQIELDHRDAASPAAGPALRRKLRQQELAAVRQIAWLRGEALAEIQSHIDRGRLPEPQRRLLFDLMQVASGRFTDKRPADLRLAGFSTEQTLKNLGLRITDRGSLVTLDPVNTAAYTEKGGQTSASAVIILRQETLDTLADFYPAVAAYIHHRLGSEYDQRQKHGLPTFAQPAPQITDEPESPPGGQTSASAVDSAPAPAEPDELPVAQTPATSPFAPSDAGTPARTSGSPSLPLSKSPPLAFPIPLSKRGQVRRSQFPDADSLAAFQFKLDADTVASARSTPAEVKKAEQRGLSLLARLMEETGLSRADLEKKLIDYHAAVVEQAEKASAFGTFTPPSFASIGGQTSASAESTLPPPIGGDILSGMREQGIRRLGPPDASDGWSWYRELQADAARSKLKNAEAQRLARAGDITDAKAKLAWIDSNVVSQTGGRSIDEAAAELSESDSQQFPVQSGDELGRAILSALDQRTKNKEQGTAPEATREAEAVSAAQDFATYAAGVTGQPFTAEELSRELEPEDEIQIGSEWFTVQETDPLTLDSARFGSITLRPDQTLNLTAGPNHLRISQSPSLQVSQSGTTDPETLAAIQNALPPGQRDFLAPSAIETTLKPLPPEQLATPQDVEEMDADLRASIDAGEALDASLPAGMEESEDLAENADDWLDGEEVSPLSASPRTVLEVDEHGKNIVWREGSFFIAVDDPGSADFITLWKDGVRGKIGHLRLTPGRENSTRGYAVVADVDILPQFRGKGLGRQLYQQAITFVADKYLGIASEQPDRANKRQVPKIWKRLGATQTEDGTFLLPRATLDASNRVTPEQDAEYLAAVEAGDMEKAQRMVDAAAITSGYKIGPVFHGSPSKFDEFDTSAEGSHFGTDEQARNLRGKGKLKVRKFYLSIKNPLRIKDVGTFSNFNNVFSHLSRNDLITPQEADEVWAAWNKTDAGGWQALKNALGKYGYDGFVYENEVEGRGDSYVAFFPSQIKSADPVTRDESGNVIPLSQRFNPESNSTLFASNRLAEVDPQGYFALDDVRLPVAKQAAASAAIAAAGNASGEPYPSQLPANTGKLRKLRESLEQRRADALRAWRGLTSGDKAAIAAAFEQNNGRISSLLHEFIQQGIPGFDIRGAVIENPQDFAAYNLAVRTPYFESVKIAVLGDGRQVIHSQIVHVGSLNESIFSPVLIAGIIDSARLANPKLRIEGFLIAHNHPSGVTDPSDADKRSTNRLRDIADTLGVPFLDHVITNGSSYFSFRENGWDGSKIKEENSRPRKPKLPVLPTPESVPARFPYERESGILADWEVVPSGDTEARPRIDQPWQMHRLLEQIGTADPLHHHLLYFDTQNKLRAVERIPADTQNIAALAITGAAREGANSIAVSFTPRPTSSFATFMTDQESRIHRRLREALQNTGIKYLDAGGFNTSSQEAWSAAEMGLMEDSTALASAPRLSAFHNLSPENLAYADRIGGLAVPSIAVLPEGQAISGFGNITLIGTRDLVDPRKNPVFDADAYTARFPDPEYKRARTADAQALVNKLRPFERQFEDRGITGNLWDNAVNNPNPQDSLQRLQRSLTGKAAFLAEQGSPVEPVMMDKPIGAEWVLEPAFAPYRADPSLIKNLNPNDEPTNRALAQSIRTAIAEYVRRTESGARVAKVLIDSYIDKDTGLPLFGRTMGIEKSLDAIGQQQVDTAATTAKLDAALAGREAAFQQWVERQILPIMGEPRLTLKGRKVPYTLDNIVQAMTSARVRGGENVGSFFGEGAARGNSATRFKDLEQMRGAAAIQIMPEEQVSAARETAKKLLADWREAVADYTTLRNWKSQPDIFGAFDAAMRAIARWAKGSQTPAALRSALQQEDFANVPDAVIEQGQKAAEAFAAAPVPYFESKPQRAVLLNEFVGAVIPDSEATGTTADILQRHGVPFRTYTGSAAQQTTAAQFAQDLAEKGALFAANRTVVHVEPGFYSALAEAIRAKMPVRSTPAAVVGILKNAGLKQEELKWTGILPWLQAQAQNGPITQQAVLDYLASDGAVRLVEVRLGDGTPRINPDAQAAVDQASSDVQRLNAAFSEETGESIQEYVTAEGSGDVAQISDKARDILDQRAEAWKRYAAATAQLQRATRPLDRAKFARYQLPGGENYREVVLAMPRLQRPDRRFREQMEAKYGDRYYALMTEEENQKYATLENQVSAAMLAGKYDSEGSNYTSGHFPDVPNYVAHARLNDRVDAEGRPGTFIEEIQSDRHQEGREKGYSSDPASLPEGYTIEVLSSQDQREKGYTHAAVKNGVRILYANSAEDAAASATRLENGANPGLRILDAPFRTTWPLQMFKRALAEAVGQGKQWIGWTTGDTQADRYDLSKQVSKIGVTRTANLNYSIDAMPTDGGRYTEIAADIPAEKLAEHVGKELATKIIQRDIAPGANAIFTGLDLRVGGQGMRKFYDDMLVKEIGKYVKQWGATVESSSIGNGKPDEPAYTTEDATSSGDGWRVKNKDGAVVRSGFANEQSAQDWIKTKRGYQATPIHLIRITPQMRDSVAAGQALFATNRNVDAIRDAAALASGQAQSTLPKGLQGLFSPSASPQTPPPPGTPRGLRRLFAPVSPSPRLPISQSLSLPAGSSTVWQSLKDAYQSLKAAGEDLTPAQFMREVKAAYDDGTVYLEFANSQAEIDAARPFVLPTENGPAIRMALLAATNRKPTPAMADMQAQAAWLDRTAKARGLANADDLAVKDPELFRQLGTQWRISHARDAEGKFVQTAAIHAIFTELHGSKNTKIWRLDESGQRARSFAAEAESHTRGNTRPGQAGPASPTPESLRAEKALLVDWARDAGLLLNKLPEAFTPYSAGDVGNMEHHVFVVDGRMLKITREDHYGIWPVPHMGEFDLRNSASSPLRYLQRILDINTTLGDDIVLHGVLQDRQGHVQIITSQPRFEGTKANEQWSALPEESPVEQRNNVFHAAVAEVRKAFAKSGFQPVTNDNRTYYRPADNTAIFDAHLSNLMWVNSEDGQRYLVPFDVTVMHPAGELRANFERLAAERSPLAASDRQLSNGTPVPDRFNVGPVYHGTPDKTFTAFSRAAINDEDEAGFWFSSSRQVASHPDYTANGAGRVIEAFLDARNPYTVTIQQWNYSEGLSPREAFAQGHDAYIVQGQDNATSYIVPNPDQIFSDAGTPARTSASPPFALRPSLAQDVAKAAAQTDPLPTSAHDNPALASSDRKAQTPPMASESGAAQANEPSPGGLSEAEKREIDWQRAHDFLYGLRDKPLPLESDKFDTIEISKVQGSGQSDSMYVTLKMIPNEEYFQQIRRWSKDDLFEAGFDSDLGSDEWDWEPSNATFYFHIRISDHPGTASLKTDTDADLMVSDRASSRGRNNWYFNNPRAFPSFLAAAHALFTNDQVVKGLSLKQQTPTVASEGSAPVGALAVADQNAPKNATTPPEVNSFNPSRADSGPLSSSPRLPVSPSPSLATQVAQAAAQTNPNPSDAQKRAGNYAKGKVDLHGLRISIENPAGSVRSGTDASGKPWSITLPHHYGYILGSEGRDGDHVDVFIGPNPDSQLVLIINQRRVSSSPSPKVSQSGFDEHKVMLGFNTPAEAARGYMASYTKGWRGLMSAVPTTIPVFKHWLTTHDTTQPVTQEQIQKLAKTLPTPTSAHDQSPVTTVNPVNPVPLPASDRTSPKPPLSRRILTKAQALDRKLLTVPGAAQSLDLAGKAVDLTGALTSKVIKGLVQAPLVPLRVNGYLAEQIGFQSPLATFGSNNLDQLIAERLGKTSLVGAAAAGTLGTLLGGPVGGIAGVAIGATAGRAFHLQARAAKQAVETWIDKPDGLAPSIKGLVDQVLPTALMPREWLALHHEMQRKTAYGAETANDLIRALSGNPRLSDLAYPKEFAENPQARQQLFDAMEGRLPMATLPPQMQRLGQRLRDLLRQTGSELVRQGLMNPDTFEELQQTGWMPRYTEDEARESAGSFLAAFKLGVRDLLQQRSTAYHIVDTTRKDKTGQFVTVSRDEGGKRNRWRFRDAASRDAFYHDFVRKQTLDMLQESGNKIVADMLAPLSRGDRAAIRSQIKSLTVDQIANTAKLSPMLAGIVKQAKKHQYDRFLPKDPFEPAKLIKDPVYAVSRYVLGQTHNAATMELLRKTAQNPEWVSDVSLTGFEAIPDASRFGPLAGKHVRKDIARQILDLVDVPNAALQFYDAILRKWKAGKLVWNPGSHIRDAVGNTVFAYLGGSSIWNPGNWPYYQQAIKALREGGSDFAELVEQQVIGGDAYSGLVKERLRGLLPDPKTVENYDPGFVQRLLFGFGAKIHASHEFLTSLRRLPDDLYKSAAYFKAKADLGGQTSASAASEAAAHVRKWFPYYDRLGQSGTTRAVGRFVNPFFSFFRESTRILGHAVAERPLALTTALAFPALITAASAIALGLDDDDLDEVKKDLSGKGKLFATDTSLFSMLLPVRSAQGALQQFDIAAIMPFADLLGTRVAVTDNTEDPWNRFWRGIVSGGPVLSLIDAWRHNEDAFTRRPIAEFGMTPLEKITAYTRHAAGVALPPLMPGGTAFATLARAGDRSTNKTLETYDPAQAVMRSVVGLNVKNATPDLYRLADDWRKAHGYEVTEGMDYGSTTPASRARKALFAQLAQDQPNLTAIGNILKALDKMGHPVRTEQDINRLLFYRDPMKLIGGNKAKGITPADAQAQFRASLQGEARQALERALQEFNRIKAKAPQLIRQATLQ